MKFFSIILSSYVAAVSAHMSMVYPLARGHPHNPNAAVKDYDCITAPLTSSSLIQSGNCARKFFPCGGYPMDTKITQVFYAGDVVDVKFWTPSLPDGPQPGSESASQARHNGGLCEFSLSYDGGKTYTVIATYNQTCPDIFFDWKVKIPDAAPSCDDPGKCIFSWSWINAIGNRELYQNCADIKLVGSNLAKPLPIIDITRANIPPEFPNIITPPGDPANTGNTKGSGPSSSDVSANMALNIGTVTNTSTTKVVENKKKKYSTLIIGCVIGGGGLVIVIIALVIFYMGRRRNTQNERRLSENSAQCNNEPGSANISSESKPAHSVI
ncbi:4562_t:CDS:1 [Ambispora gerdemannii]|uniref:4562_t:CDS:1 n=1 Tax=Ambispora gerdemannii TaxID=144530 RepID=A0A9N8VRA8_9GLOM|nr:4562_t:CDS:1 [Ambispora gerdemannii]